MSLNGHVQLSQYCNRYSIFHAYATKRKSYLRMRFSEKRTKMRAQAQTKKIEELMAWGRVSTLPRFISDIHRSLQTLQLSGEYIFPLLRPKMRGNSFEFCRFWGRVFDAAKRHQKPFTREIWQGRLLKPFPR